MWNKGINCHAVKAMLHDLVNCESDLCSLGNAKKSYCNFYLLFFEKLLAFNLANNC